MWAVPLGSGRESNAADVPRQDIALGQSHGWVTEILTRFQKSPQGFAEDQFEAADEETAAPCDG
jgi:hypothetical protein